MCPTLAGFIAWARQQGVPIAALPDASPYWGYAYSVAIDIVALVIQRVSPQLYMLAVYNLAMDNLINWCPDQEGSTYFADLRDKWKVSNFVPGVVTASSDESTSTGITNPDFMKGLTMSDLQNLKTPFGRAYLAIAQRVGPLWGLS